VVGTHIVDFEGDLVKNRLDSNGKIVESWSHGEKHKDDAENINLADAAFDAREGCKLSGSILVNKVSGNFHVSSHSFPNSAQTMLVRGKRIDFSHKVNHLSFGSEENYKQVKRAVKTRNLSPLDSHQEMAKTNPHGGGHMHFSFTTYYMTVTPAKYNIDGNEYFVHEFTHSHQTVQSHQYPAAWFRFQLSPVFVNYDIKNMSLLNYLIRLCAIMGGVYTVAGMVEGIIYSVVEDI